jgi:hypothetical protein
MTRPLRRWRRIRSWWKCSRGCRGEFGGDVFDFEGAGAFCADAPSDDVGVVAAPIGDSGRRSSRRSSGSWRGSGRGLEGPKGRAEPDVGRVRQGPWSGGR